MTVGIIGLGLIGGSLALATKKYTDHKVLGFDIEKKVVNLAFELNAIDDELSDKKMCECDLIIVALTPKLACEYFPRVAEKMKDGAILSDITGVKKDVVPLLKSLSEKFPKLNFISSHPMAGREVGGLINAQSDLFVGGYTIIVDVQSTDLAKETIADFHKNLGVKGVVFADASRHDKMIAYTSQLAHIVSASYVKNVLSKDHKGFSAGSFQDMTRVARLNPKMWTELCLENSENLCEQLDDLIVELTKFKEAIANKDESETLKLFEKSLECKIVSENK